MATLAILATAKLAAAELEVRIQPANAALRDNVVNHIGDLGQRSAAELTRYQPLARRQASAALQALGYYRSEIDLRVEPGEPPRLILDIRPGDPVRLRQVDIVIEGPAAAEGLLAADDDHLKAGRVLNHGRYEAAKQRIQSRALRFGYFDGHFTRSRLRIDPEAGVADIDLRYASGPRYRFGAVTFSGEQPLDESLLQRMVPFTAGSPYDSESLAALNRALQSSGYFDVVRVDASPAGVAPGGEIPVGVRLSGRKPRTFGLGLGYSTDVGPRLRFDWIRHWQNPAGHRYGIEAEVAQPRQNVSTWYEIPLANPLTDSLRLVGGYQYQELADNDSMSRLLSAGPEWHTRLENGVERVISLKALHEEYRLGDDSGLANLLMPGIAFSLLRSDNAISPNRGYRLDFSVAAAREGLFSDTDLIHGELGGKGLVTLLSRHRLLGRAQFGANLAGEYDDVPPSLRFFAGGDQSVRGYDYQTLSPTNSDGDRIGGRYQFTASVEYQYALTEKWRLASFVDQGNAFDSLSNVTLFSSVGVGLRWVSPVGPIRVDLAHALDGDGGIRLHFSVGPEL